MFCQIGAKSKDLLRWWGESGLVVFCQTGSKSKNLLGWEERESSVDQTDWSSVHIPAGVVGRERISCFLSDWSHVYRPARAGGRDI